MESHTHWLPRLLRIWSGYTFFVFAVMLTHKSDYPIVLGRYSLLVSASLIGLFIFAVGMLIVRRILQDHPKILTEVDLRLAAWRSRPLFTPLVLLVSSMMLIIVWLFFLGDHLPTYGVLRAFLGITFGLASLALLFRGEKEQSSTNWQIIFILCMVIIGFASILTIEQRPALMKTDEAYYASDFVGLSQSGKIQPSIYRLVWNTDFESGLWSPIAFPYFQVVGLSLETGRLFFFLVGLAALPFLFAALKRLYGSLGARFGIGLAFYAFSSANHIRPDVVAGLFLAIAFFCYSQTEKHRIWYFLTGAAVVTCMNNSPITYCFGVGFGLYFFGRYLNEIRINRNWKWSPFWLLLAGELSALAYFLMSHSGYVLAGNVTMVGLGSQYIGNIGQHIVSGSFLMIAQQGFTSFFTAQPILSSFALLGVAVALWQRKSTDVLLLTLLGSWLVIVIFTYIYFPPYNVTYGIPLLVLLAVRGIVFGINSLLDLGFTDQPAYGRSLGILLGVWLIVATVADTREAVSPSNSLMDVINTAYRIGKIVPKDEVIVAGEAFYFGLIDHPNFVGGFTDQFLVSNKGLTDYQAWQKIAPDAVVFSSSWPIEPYRNSDILTYMQQNQFGLAGCWQTLSYGRIELWMRHSTVTILPEASCPMVSS